MRAADLWADCFDRPDLRTPDGLDKVAKALEHSYTVAYAFCEHLDDDALSSGDELQEPELIGAARTLSDGQFAAQILDVCVHERYQRQGVGRRLLQQLCTETKAAGPQSVAVFASSVRFACAWFIASKCRAFWSQREPFCVGNAHISACMVSVLSSLAFVKLGRCMYVLEQSGMVGMTHHMLQEHWLFFGKCGFRWDFNYKIMIYTGRIAQPQDYEATQEDLQALFGSRLI